MAKLKEKFSIASITGTGKTKTEARNDAIEQAKEALERDTNAIIITVRGASAVLYNTPFGWNVVYVTRAQKDMQPTDQKNPRVFYTHETSRNGLDAVIYSTKGDLAQESWDGESLEMPFDSGEAYYLQLNDDYRKWLHTQLRYRAALAEGFTKDEALSLMTGDFHMLTVKGMTPERLEKAKVVFDSVKLS